MKVNRKFCQSHEARALAVFIAGFGLCACNGSDSGPSTNSGGGAGAPHSTGGSAGNAGPIGGAGGNAGAVDTGGSAGTSGAHATGGAGALDTGGSAGAGGFHADGGNSPKVWAETNSIHYAYDSSATTTLHNDGVDPVYLPGCQCAYVEKTGGGAWRVDTTPFCSSSDPEPNAGKLAPGSTLGDSFTFNPHAPKFGGGTGRVRYSVGYGCQDGVPFSQAQCARVEDVYTPDFTVDDCVCPNGRCPTRDALCSVSCPPLTIGAAVSVGGYADVGCGLRVVTRRIGYPAYPDVYAYDAVTGELVAAIVRSGNDTQWGPCFVIDYSFGDTQPLNGTFGGLLGCAGSALCQATGDPMVASNWACPSGGSGGAGGSGGVGGAGGAG
jgi:hypothetical protein